MFYDLDFLFVCALCVSGEYSVYADVFVWANVRVCTSGRESFGWRGMAVVIARANVLQFSFKSSDIHNINADMRKIIIIIIKCINVAQQRQPKKRHTRRWVSVFY